METSRDWSAPHGCVDIAFMMFPSPLVRGRLVRRYKRFFADVVLDDGTEITAHCPNPGAMLGVNAPGLPVWLSRSADPKRKLAHTLELVETAEGALTGVNTLHPSDRNKLGFDQRLIYSSSGSARGAWTTRA